MFILGKILTCSIGAKRFIFVKKKVKRPAIDFLHENERLDFEKYTMLHHILTGRVRWLIHFIGWLSTFLLFFYLIGAVRGWQEGFSRAVVNTIFLLILFYGNAKLLVNRYFEAGRWRELIIYSAIFLFTLAFLRAYIETYLLTGGPIKVVTRTFRFYILFLAYASGFFLLLVFSTLYQLLENRNMLDLRHQELQTRHMEAQLNLLKAQINPHFLFNTLNSIYAAATLQHPHTAQMVMRLSEFLRYVTYDAQSEKVPLPLEIAQIESYIELFQLKSPEPLPISLEITGDPAVQVIEPVLLLPIIENALKHGDVEHNSSGWIKMHFEISENGLSFRVKNTFDPKNHQKDSVGGVGLDNIRQRLFLNYPGRFVFETSINGHVFETFLQIKSRES